MELVFWCWCKSIIYTFCRIEGFHRSKKKIHCIFVTKKKKKKKNSIRPLSNGTKTNGLYPSASLARRQHEAIIKYQSVRAKKKRNRDIYFNEIMWCSHLIWNGPFINYEISSHSLALSLFFIALCMGPKTFFATESVSIMNLQWFRVKVKVFANKLNHAYINEPQSAYTNTHWGCEKEKEMEGSGGMGSLWIYKLSFAFNRLNACLF